MTRTKRKSNDLNNVVRGGMIGIITPSFTKITSDEVEKLSPGTPKEISRLTPTMVSLSGLGALKKGMRKQRW